MGKRGGGKGGSVVRNQRATLVHGEERLRPDGVAGCHGRGRAQEDEDSLQHDDVRLELLSWKEGSGLYILEDHV